MVTRQATCPKCGAAQPVNNAGSHRCGLCGAPIEVSPDSMPLPVAGARPSLKPEKGKPARQQAKLTTYVVVAVLAVVALLALAGAMMKDRGDPVQIARDIDSLRGRLLKADSPGLVFTEAYSELPHTAVVVVSNMWHIMPYQVRLQGVQNLHRAWVEIHSENARKDVAALRVVDRNRNEVGRADSHGAWVQNK